ncbi:protein transport protein SEC20, putative [Plasmodium reichenowi]|uniref:Protein transport protein SEC20, putative n=1 Tax=Plasmodium reichenowi TaxID=5854 RepID=A0A151L6N9_PLARE|nr:protein transport protein SEC20, putative [Plasmodium reichenowi]KYN94609.1 protein transport protein SEC20, putative [Plasmodium reichenowi]SOV81807.1 protein transport protein SEC20, putative [Plasmodium reichenowi]
MNHNFKRSLDINNKNVDDNINKINSIINQMRLVDENLKSLFSFEETLNDHDALLLFRGRVSKRIVDYSNLITECDNNLTCSEYISPNLKEQYEYHLKNVDNYKRELSVWWNGRANDYHRLCMENFLNRKISDINVTSNDDDRNKLTDINLKDTKKLMIDEINRMKNVKSELIESSQKLKKQDEIFNIFEMKIRSSAKLIYSLKKKAESDTRYVWYSFFFFVSICVYITMRRLGLLRAMFTLIKLIVSLLFYVSKLCFKIFELFKKTNEAKYTPTVDNSKSLVLVPVNNEL